MSQRAKLASNTPEQKRLRSERAKLQHARGNIPYRPLVNPVRVCTRCGDEFARYKKVGGGYYSGNRCLTCMAAVFAFQGGRFHLEEFEVSVDEFDNAAFELTWCREYSGGVS